MYGKKGLNLGGKRKEEEMTFPRNEATAQRRRKAAMGKNPRGVAGCA